MRIPPIPGLVRLAKAVDMQNVTVSTAEVISALGTGMVDGIMTSIKMFDDWQLEKRTPYVLKANLAIVGVVFIANVKFWNSLPPDLQKILQGVFDEYAEKKIQANIKTDEANWRKYAATPGNIITTLNKKERAEWLAAVQPAWADLKAKSEEHKKVIEAIDSIRQ